MLCSRLEEVPLNLPFFSLILIVCVSAVMFRIRPRANWFGGTVVLELCDWQSVRVRPVHLHWHIKRAAHLFQQTIRWVWWTSCWYVEVDVCVSAAAHQHRRSLSFSHQQVKGQKRWWTWWMERSNPLVSLFFSLPCYVTTSSPAWLCIPWVVPWHPKTGQWPRHITACFSFFLFLNSHVSHIWRSVSNIW